MELMNGELGKSIALAAEVVASACSLVVFTGAGVSAESGIDTFRDAQTGLWSHFDPQQLASQAGFAADPGLVWRWYMHRLARVEQATPNPGHQALADLERLTPSLTLITQNVDDLHERAGNQRVLHLHGHIGRFHCNGCQTPYALQPDDYASPTPPQCMLCLDYVRPSVVWFGEILPEQALNQAWRAAEQCEVFLVIGTSGVVYPAAQLPLIAKRHGAHVIEINPEISALSDVADVTLRAPGGEALPRLVAEVGSQLRKDRTA
ncbi:MAG TPA: NAD-dependent deacylase [Caldilinea sp.]|nr:NAD-dependent deacylase [Caldilinea sp.]